MRNKILMALICIGIIQYAQAQKDQVKNYGLLDLSFNYLLSTDSKFLKNDKPLYEENGIGAGLSYRFGRKLGITTTLGYSTGKVNENKLQEYGNTLVKSPYIAKVNVLNSNWSKTNFMIGPSIIFAKRYMEFHAKVGAIKNMPNDISIDNYDGKTKFGSLVKINQNSLVPSWEVGLNILGTKLGKNSFWTLKTSYGNTGLSVGINITALTSSCCCIGCLYMCQRIGLCGGMQPAEPEPVKKPKGNK